MITFNMGDLTVNISDPVTNLFLLIVLIVLTVAVYFLMIFLRRKRVSHFGNLSTLQKVHGFKRFYINPAILLVKIIIIILLFLAATESVSISRLNPTTDTDYVLVLDVSPSMAMNDYDPDRLTAAKEISLNWLRLVSRGTAVGLVVFSDGVIEEVPLSLDKQEMIRSVENAFVNYSRSGTDPNKALLNAIELLEQSTQNKTVLFLTDGSDEIFNDTIFKARDNVVTIYSFGIGSNETVDLFDDVPEEFLEFFDTMDFNFEVLDDLSNRTGGEAFSISNVQELKQAFDEATLEKIKIELNSQYYVLILIALLSITEFLIYSRLGGL